jgi:hypothetical protein
LYDAAATLTTPIVDTNVADNSLDTILSFIVTAIQPEKIFLLYPGQQEAIDSTTFVDLLIVIADNCNASFSDYEMVNKAWLY